MPDGSNAGRSAVGRACIELFAIALLFAAAGAWPAPDTNEAHFLTKARYAADPAWCRGDFFLESADAHRVFYMLFGPLAAAVPLDTAAWIGRGLGWLAVAVGFRHAIVPLVTTTWGRIAAAALFSLALRFTTAAGEWVIGGCEAKVFAWALVLAGVGEAVRGRFASACCTCGAAAALHPLVGGWALVAVTVAWARERWSRGAAGAVNGSGAAAAWLGAGAALAACGVLPALGMNAGVDAATRAAANEIYVVERLSHHLLPRAFAAPLVARHLLAIVAWWLLFRLLPPAATRRRLATLVGAAVVISAGGWLVSLAEPLAPALAHAILRFYWFRLADVLVPLALATTAAAVLEDGTVCRAAVPVPPALTRWVAAALICLDVAAESPHWPWPGGAAVAARADVKVDPAAWADVCAWVRDHAPAEACFLTPRGAASFTWRTGRREVVSWKNVPQDARSVVEWRRRFADCFSLDAGLGDVVSSPAALGVDRLREVAARYGADHAIVPLETCGLETLPFQRLHENAGYVVLRLDPLTAGGRPAGPP
ncbi:MAG: DUF6798 domain-containing protein [Planctomycetaceae bacterium]